MAAGLLAGGACRGRYIRPVTGERFEATPERLQRGQYLVNQVMACGACHTGRATGDPFVESEQTDQFLAGGNLLDLRGIGRIHVGNLTPDSEGLGDWADDEILRALRDGVDRTGRFLLPMMPYDSYRHLSDEDGKAVVVYLRSIPAAKSARPAFEPQIGFFARVLFMVIGVQMHAPVAGVAAPPRTNPIAYGLYVARVAGCTYCHSMTRQGPRKPEDPLFMAGSDWPFEDARLGKVYARNLTPDLETGIGRYKPADVKAAIRNGRRLDGRRMAPPMSVMVPHYSGMTDEDLDALVAFVGSLKPARHAVPEPDLSAEARRLVDAP